LMYDRAPAGISESKTGISGSRSCTKITIWCVCVFETYELAPKPRFRRTIRNGLNLTDQPEPGGSRRPGRRPHVPSSKPTMSKSRRASSPGSIGSGHRLYRPRRGAKRTRDPVQRPRPLAGGAYMCGSPTRQPAFCNFAAVCRSTGSGRLPEPLA